MSTKKLAITAPYDWEHRPWGSLMTQRSSVIEKVIAKWEALLDDDKTTERDCLSFVQDHGALFFGQDPSAPILLSEIRLGADYRIDFVTAVDGYSDGTSYSLWEFESPQISPLRKDGKISAGLSGALDQVNDWARWLSQERSQSRSLFPSYRWQYGEQAIFQRVIVIGRRHQANQYRDKIWSRIHDRGVTVISYDRFTDILKRRVFWDVYRMSEPWCSDLELREPNALNYAACPFFRALSDQKWKQLRSIRCHGLDSHFEIPYLVHLVPLLEVNKCLLEEFDSHGSA
jgi:hypothetical protein